MVAPNSSCEGGWQEWMCRKKDGANRGDRRRTSMWIGKQLDCLLHAALRGKMSKPQVKGKRRSRLLQTEQLQNQEAECWEGGGQQLPIFLIPVPSPCRKNGLLKDKKHYLEGLGLWEPSSDHHHPSQEPVIWRVVQTGPSHRVVLVVGKGRWKGNFGVPHQDPQRYNGEGGERKQRVRDRS